MGSAYDYMKASPVWHLATVDGNQPRVRPFGFVMKRAGKLYFCTGKSKDVYKQLVKNPVIEISAMGKDNTWLRLAGKVVMDDSRDAKAQVLKEMPALKRFYRGGADDENFVTFFLESGKATLYSFSAAPQELPLL